MRSLWAVARQTFIECLRTRVAAVFLVLLAVCVLGMALTLEGDGTLKGRIQTFLAYSASTAQLLLGLVTVFLATGVVAGDIRRKTLLVVASKPLARWQYVLGRWLGLVMLDGLLLAASLASIYGLAQYLRRLPTQAEQKQARAQAAEELDVDRLAVENEVFAARDRRPVDPVDVEGQVKERLATLEEERGADNVLRQAIRRRMVDELQARGPQQGLDENEVEQAMRDPLRRQQALADLARRLRAEILEERNLVAPGNGLLLTFSNLRLPPGAGETLQLRYRLRPIHTPQSLSLQTSWQVINPQTGDLYYLTRTDGVEMDGSVMIPPQAVSPEGRLGIIYINNTNLQEQPTAVKVRSDEVSLLYRTGGFTVNLVRAGEVMLLRLMFLAGAGVLLGTFLSFPVACLTCLLFFAIGAASGFILEATRISAYGEGHWFEYFSHYLTRGVYLFLPAFGKVSPTDALVDGMNIPASVVGQEVLSGSGPRTLLALGVGCLIFWRRELAKVQA